MSDKIIQLHKEGDSSEHWFPNTYSNCVTIKGYSAASAHVNIQNNTPLNSAIGGIVYDIGNITSTYATKSELSSIPIVESIPYASGNTQLTGLKIGSTSYKIETSGGGGSGTVYSGSQYQLAYYAANGTAVSGKAELVYNSNGFCVSNSLKFARGNATAPIGLIDGYDVRDSTYGGIMINGSSSGDVKICGGGGSVGIGNVSTIASGAKLHVKGSIYAEGSVTCTGSSSDKRLKENVKPFNGLDIVNKLAPVSFTWNDTAKGISDDFKDGTNYGLIAQNSDGLIDDFVFDMPTGYKGVRYEKLIPILLEAVKEQQEEIIGLKNKIVELENR